MACSSNAGPNRRVASLLRTIPYDPGSDNVAATVHVTSDCCRRAYSTFRLAARERVFFHVCRPRRALATEVQRGRVHRLSGLRRALQVLSGESTPTYICFLSQNSVDVE